MLLLPQLSHSELDSDSRAVGSASIRLQTLRFDQRRFAGQVLARHAGLSASYVSAAVGGMRGGGWQLTFQLQGLVGLNHRGIFQVLSPIG